MEERLKVVVGPGIRLHAVIKVGINVVIEKRPEVEG